MRPGLLEAYRWAKAEDRRVRDLRILEAWQLGTSRKDIAEAEGITKQRVSQIVNSRR